MTIKKLIEKLSKYDDSFEVGQSDDFGYYVGAYMARQQKSFFSFMDQ